MGADLPHVYYYNHVGQRSRGGLQRLTWQGMEIEVHISIGDAETITVTSPNNDFIPRPATADVIDGEAVKIDLLPAMF